MTRIGGNGEEEVVALWALQENLFVGVEEY
jgi:hypothetical protein